MLRREKRDVELTLPKKTETIIEVELTLTQKRWYRAVFERNRNFLMQGPSKKIPSLINVLMQLRKVCNHPFLVAGSREAVYEDHYAAETAELTAAAASAANEDTSTSVSVNLSVNASVNVDVDVDGSSINSNIKVPTSVTATAAPRSSISDPSNNNNDNTTSISTLSSASNTAVSDVPSILPFLPPLRPLKIFSLDSQNLKSNDGKETNVIKSELTPPSTDIQKTSLTEEAVIEDKKIDTEISDSKVLPVVDCSSQQNLDPALKDPLVYCSGKIVFLHKLLIKLKRENSKSLIFSQFTTTLDVIQEYLTAYGYFFEVRAYVPSVC